MVYIGSCGYFTFCRLDRWTMTQTVNEFMLALAESGVDFTFSASHGEMRIVGECIQLEEGYKVTKRKLATVEESRAKLKQFIGDKS